MINLPAKQLKGNEPAFIEHNTTINDSHIQKGLTIRQYFAAMAMQACRTMSPSLSSDILAQQAVMDAEALINELNKK